MNLMRTVFYSDLYRYSDRSSIRAICGALLRNPGYAACIIMRMQQVAYSRGSVLQACMLRYAGIAFLGFDSVPGNEVQAGLFLPHPSGVVIGKAASIGRNGTLLQHVTLGERYLDGTKPHLYPRLGDSVTIGAGAKVLGGIRIGDRTVIGANSVVLIDCPTNSVVVGAPAEVVRIRNDDIFSPVTPESGF